MSSCSLFAVVSALTKFGMSIMEYKTCPKHTDQYAQLFCTHFCTAVNHCTLRGDAVKNQAVLRCHSAAEL